MRGGGYFFRWQNGIVFERAIRDGITIAWDGLHVLGGDRGVAGVGSRFAVGSIAREGICDAGNCAGKTGARLRRVGNYFLAFDGGQKPKRTPKADCDFSFKRNIFEQTYVFVLRLAVTQVAANERNANENDVK